MSDALKIKKKLALVGKLSDMYNSNGMHTTQTHELYALLHNRLAQSSITYGTQILYNYLLCIIYQ